MRWREGIGFAGDVVTLWLGAPLVVGAIIAGLGYLGRLPWPLIVVLALAAFGVTMMLIGSYRRRHVQAAVQQMKSPAEELLDFVSRVPRGTNIAAGGGGGGGLGGGKGGDAIIGDQRPRGPTFEPSSVHGTISRVALNDIGLPEPAVWFDVSLNQASGYFVTVNSISGHISIGGRRCNLAPTVERGVEIGSMMGDQVAQIRQPVSAELATEIRTTLERDDGVVVFDLTALVMHGTVRLDPYDKAGARPTELRYTTRSVAVLGPLRFTVNQEDLSSMVRFEPAFGSQTYYDTYGRRKRTP